MPMFEELFAKSTEPNIVFKNKNISRAIIKNGPCKLKATINFVSSNSIIKQGISFSMFTMKGSLTCNGKTVKKGGFDFWYDNSPKTFEVDIDINEGDLCIFNICEDHDHRGVAFVTSFRRGMALYTEEIGSNKHRVYCNDVEHDEDFDDLIFDIEFINK